MGRVIGAGIAGLAFGLLGLATLGMDGSLHYPFGYTQVLIAGVALLFFASAARDWREAQTAAGDLHNVPVSSDLPGGPRALWATIALCIVYAIAWPVIGFFPATFLYVATQLWLLRERKWQFVIGVPATVTLVVYIVFAVILTLPFPMGMLFED